MENNETLMSKDIEIEETKRMLDMMKFGIEDTAQGKYLDKAILLLNELQDKLDLKFAYENEKTFMHAFEVTTFRCGQPRPYADSHYEYTIRTNKSDYEVKQFCTKVLCYCKQEKKDWKQYSEDPGSYFHGYYTFDKIDNNTYRYYVFQPFCD